MALVKATLKSKIKSILNFSKTQTDQDQSIEYIAENLTNAIDEYIKSATVTVQPGINVSTAGTATTQTGATTSTGTGTIS